MAKKFTWDDTLKGMQIPNPFNSKETITLDGRVDEDNQIYGTLNKDGKPYVGSNIMVDVEGRRNKTASVKPKAKLTDAPIRKYDSGLRDLTDAPIRSFGNGMQAEVKAPSSGTGVEVSEEMSMPIDFKGSPVEAVKDESFGKTSPDYHLGQMILAGSKFLYDLHNANNAYRAIDGQAQLNIMQARNQAEDALYRGRAAQLSAESDGRQLGDDALLAMAAQGQDVSGGSVQKIQKSYEAVGIMNGMKEKVNSIREALGYEMEEINYEYQVDNAEIARQNTIIGSGLDAAARMYTYGSL